MSARTDAERLDWLVANFASFGRLTRSDVQARPNGLPPAVVSRSALFVRVPCTLSYEWHCFDGATAREALDASEDGTGRGTPIVARCVTAGEGQRNDWETCTLSVTAGIPRRLTPRECERLMGWPDDHTRWGVNERGRTYELPDSARYQICGNGIGGPHTHWVGLRFGAALAALRQAVAA